MAHSDPDTWRGVIAAMDTPMSQHGARLNLDEVPRLLAFLKEAGVIGVFVAGSTGLGPLLTLKQREALAAAAVGAAAGLVVLVHVGAESTRDAIQLTEHALQSGASGVAVSVPPYYNHTRSAILRHFKAVADAARPMPTFLYRLGRDTWTLDDMRLLQETCPNLAGFKDSAGDLEFTREAVASGVRVFQGDERLAKTSLELGVQGLVSGMATALPESIVKLYELLMDPARALEADRYQAFIRDLRELLIRPNAYACFKAILRHRGFEVGRVPGPFEDLEPASEERLIRRLQELGVSL